MPDMDVQKMKKEIEANDSSISSAEEDENGDFVTKTFKIPESAIWNQSVSYSDYKKLLEGFSPVRMEQKWYIESQEPNPVTGKGSVKMCQSWLGCEVIRGEFYLIQGVDKSSDNAYAVFDKIIWEKDPKRQCGVDEADAKSTFIRLTKIYTDATLKEFVAEI